MRMMSLRTNLLEEILYEAMLPFSQSFGDTAMSEANTLFEIDRELDSLLDQIEEEAEENGAASPDLLERFQQFCQAESDKVDRIGRFLTLMDSRLKYCRQQAEHFQKRARTAEAKVMSTKSMVLYFLAARGLKKIEGKEFTLRLQKNSQDSVEITDASQVPIMYRELELRVPGRLWQAVLADLPEDRSKLLASCIRDDKPSNDAIKEAASHFEEVLGAKVKRGVHLRVA
jgi:hypothetical protein